MVDGTEISLASRVVQRVERLRPIHQQELGCHLLSIDPKSAHSIFHCPDQPCLPRPLRLRDIEILHEVVLDLLLTGVDLARQQPGHSIQQFPMVVIESAEGLRQAWVDLKETLSEQDIGVALDDDIAAQVQQGNLFRIRTSLREDSLPEELLRAKFHTQIVEKSVLKRRQMLSGGKLGQIPIMRQADEMFSCGVLISLGKGHPVLVGFVVEFLHRFWVGVHCLHNVLNKAVEDKGCAVFVHGCYVLGTGDHVKGFPSESECVWVTGAAKPASESSVSDLVCITVR